MQIFTADPDLTDANKASDFFQNGTWGRPVLRYRSEDRGRILIAPLLSPNPVMMMERWMARTGMIDDEKVAQRKTVRGKVFERVASDRLRFAGLKNSCLTDFGVASLRARGNGTEEIDVIVRFGSTIVICELKCFKVPFEPTDRYNHLKKIREAADQANRKTDWAQKIQAPIFDALSLSQADRCRVWKFVPLVVLNTAYGAGLVLDGCGITDLDWMATFLGSPNITTGGVFERGRSATMHSKTIYRDQNELEQNLVQVATSPPSLASELGRIEFEMLPFPTGSGDPIQLQIPVSKGIPSIPSTT